ncbi:MAG: LysR family transcriptional regulator [Alphaproteobacteria bacterium]
MIPIAEMVVFAEVVEAGSLSAAARRLGTSKSAISAQLQRLEARLGVRLLNRTTRRLSTTEAGAACYAHCARMKAEADAARRTAAAFQAEPRGTLRISAPDTFGAMHIAPAIPSFLDRHPGLKIELSLSGRHVDLIEGGFDLAIRIGTLPDSSLGVRRLAESRLAICAAPAYLAVRGTPTDIDALEKHNCLRFTPLGWGSAWRLHGPDGPVHVAIGDTFATDSGDVLLSVARAGLGLALLPTWMTAGDLRRGTLVAVLRDWAPPPVAIQAIFPGPRLRMTKVEAFIDHLARRFRRAPDWEAHG